MSAKPKFPVCVICGKPGIPIGVISQKNVVVCTACAPELYRSLEELVSAMGAPRVGKAVERKKPSMSPEELKGMVAKTVEERGSTNLFEYCKRYGVSRKDARKVAEELANEKGWKIEEVKGKLYLRKPEQVAA